MYILAYDILFYLTIYFLKIAINRKFLLKIILKLLFQLNIFTKEAKTKLK